MVQKRVFHLQRVVGAVRVFQSVDHTGPEKKAAGSLFQNLGSIHVNVTVHTHITRTLNKGN
jgi:hypothetical protein